MHGLLPLALATALVACASLPGSDALASARPDSPNRSHAGWMPDVAGRLESLRERTERADAQAQERALADLQHGQWWRSVAVLPRHGTANALAAAPAGRPR